MKKLLTITTIATISLFSVGGVADVHAELSNTTTTPTSTITVSDTTSPTTTVINKLLSQVQKEQSNLQERFTKIQKKADQLIQERISSIQNEITKLNASKYANSTDTQAEVTSLQTTITSLTSLKTQIDAMTYSDSNSITTLKALVTQIFTSYRVYCEELPKTSATEHLQQLSTIQKNALTIEQNLANDVEYAQSQGKNITTIAQDQAKYDSDVQKLSTDLTSAEAQVNSLTPASCTSNGSVYSQLKTTFETLHMDVINNKQDLETFTKDFKSLFESTTSSQTVSATATPSVSITQ